MDVAVAKVMGWTCVGPGANGPLIGPDEWTGVPPGAMDAYRRGDRDRLIAWLPLYSTGVASMRALCADLKRVHGICCTLGTEDSSETCLLESPGGTRIESRSPRGQAPLAVCLAVLQAFDQDESPPSLIEPVPAEPRIRHAVR